LIQCAASGPVAAAGAGFARVLSVIRVIHRVEVYR
jgi:hypothetical protein